MRKLLLSVLTVLILLGRPAYAVKVSNLYQVDLPVASQSELEKSKAIKLGFSQLLIKLSGDPQIEKNPELKAVLKTPESYVQEFTYVNTPESSHPYQIQIHYNKPDIEEILKKASISYWGENRPQVLAWIALANPNHGTVVVGSETGGSLLAVMKERSNQFGVPLVFPAMDVGDLSQLTSDDVVRMNLPVIREASKRYASEALLLGRIEQTAKDYQSTWHLVLGDAQWDWAISGKTADAVVAQVLDKLSVTLARHYVATASNAEDRQVLLTVTNVSEPADLNELLEHLKQMTSVKQIQLMQITGDKVDVSVQLHGTIEAFQKNATLGQHLMLKSQLGEDRLLFEWSRAAAGTSNA